MFYWSKNNATKKALGREKRGNKNKLKDRHINNSLNVVTKTWKINWDLSKKISN